MGTWQNFIGNETRLSSQGRTSPVRDPVTGETYTRAPVSDSSDIDAAMAAAAGAYPQWSVTTPAFRQEALLRIATAVEDQTEPLLAAECRNTGKPKEVTREAEFGQMIDQIRFLAGAARCLEGRAAGEYLPGHTSYVRREPIGVCAQITPWNYPLLMVVWKAVPAIAAGNTVVLKPSDLTPVSTLKLAEIVADILPPGVLNVVCGDRDTGRSLVAHPTPAMVSLTGSVRAGTEVAGTAAADIKRVHLELGGKAPVVVFDDADLAHAASAISEAGYFNAGQDCAAATRVLVGEAAHDEFVDALVDAADAIKVGHPEDPAVTCGPLISEQHASRVTGFLERLPGHTEVVTGGTGSREGNFLRPTVVTGVRPDDEIAREEVFGPVITVEAVPDEETAVRSANAVEYGLTSSVWTRDHGRALRMAQRLDFGCVWINTHLPLPAEMPHGGFKHSGYGKDMSVYALEDYTRIKHVMTDHRV